MNLYHLSLLIKAPTVVKFHTLFLKSYYTFCNLKTEIKIEILNHEIAM